MTRKRSRGGHDKAYYRTVDINPNGSISGAYVLNTSISCNGTLDTIEDVVTIDYKRRKAMGQVIMSDVKQTEDRRWSTPVNWVFGTHPMWGARQLYGDVAAVNASNGAPPYPSYIADSAIPALEDFTLMKALARVSPATMESLVSVAEAKKTSQMLYRPFQNSLTLLGRMVTRRAHLVRNGLDFAKASTQAYLEYRFGWKPIINDFKNACEAHVVHDQVRNLRLVARASEERSWILTGRQYSSTFNGGIQVASSADYHRVLKCSAGYLYEIVDENANASLQRALGLRVADLPGTMWELVPFSFVLDRFVNIGTWLRAIVPKPGVKIRGSWVTTKITDINAHRVTEAKLFVSAMGIYPAITYRHSGGGYTENIRRKIRRGNPAQPVLPSFDTGDLSLVQHLDHAALITQVLRTFDAPGLRKMSSR